MENFILTVPSGAELAIKIDGYNASITVLEAGPVVVKYELKDLAAIIKPEQMEVCFVVCKYEDDVCLDFYEDNVFAEKPLSYSLEPSELDSGLPAKRCINEILFRLYQYRCFDDAGEFHQYEP